MLQVVPHVKKYSSADLAKILGIPEGTLRSYKHYFTSAGVTFTKEGRKVSYSEADLKMFQRMASLYKDGYGTIKECVGLVVTEAQQVQHVERQAPTSPTIPTQTVTMESLSNEIKELKIYINERLEKQEQRLEKRDRQLMEVVRDIQKSKEAQTKKGFWQWFQRLIYKKKEINS